MQPPQGPVRTQFVTSRTVSGAGRTARALPIPARACISVRRARRWAMHRIGTVLAAFALWITPAVAGPVETQSGLVAGVRMGDLTVYKGVPFAAPPIGALRWRPPQAPPAWQGVRKADSFAPACMQSGVSMPGETPPRTSEDCLYLNIWAPARGSRHAVMVWIYGGGFSNGSAAMPLYWGDELARKGIVAVTFGYRLGPFGFLALPELTKESPFRSSGNYGLMDQIAALEWVHDNIAAFGGDPARVTVAGQSAGAASVSILMASPLAKGLFRGAIAESGGMFEPLQLAPSYTLANAERDGEAFEKKLGASSLAQLRALPASALLKPQAGFHPVLEPHVMPLSPYDAFAQGKQNDVPILIGSNANEAGSLIPDIASVKASTFESDILKAWGPLPPALFAAYPHATDAEARRARLDFERDLRFGWDMWAWARLESATGFKPVYYYHFTHVPPFPKGSIYQDWGASHYAELFYVFGHLAQEPWSWASADRKLAGTMTDYWVNFVKSGNPNAEGDPPWPRFDRSGKVLYLDEPITVGGVADLKTLSVFDAVYANVRGAALPEKRN
ncbi:MAG: carboxylesterase/lipase family protein [Rhizomicrobium sp.]